MSTAKKYRQLKSLPFQKVDSIWEVVYYENDIVDVTINGCVYTNTLPGLWVGLARYYLSDGNLMMDDDRDGEKWFEDVTNQDF